MNNYKITNNRATQRKSAVRTATSSRVSSIVSPETGNTARTPYHSLSGEGGMQIPRWAQHRSVYRVAGRTLYLIETDRVDEAKLDLKRLDRAGWTVQITESSAGSLARIALTRRELARVA